MSQLPSYKSTVTAMTFTPDSRNLITAHADQKVWITIYVCIKFKNNYIWASSRLLLVYAKATEGQNLNFNQIAVIHVHYVHLYSAYQ